MKRLYMLAWVVLMFVGAMCMAWGFIEIIVGVPRIGIVLAPLGFVLLAIGSVGHARAEDPIHKEAEDRVDIE